MIKNVFENKYRKWPRVSLIYTFYNQLDYLKFQLKLHDYINQSGVLDFDLIICDDGSSDGTKEFMEEELREDLHLYTIQYVRQEDKGMRVGIAKNRGIQEALGELIYVSDGDTFPLTETYVKLMDALRDNEGVPVMGKRYKVDWEEIVDTYKLRPSEYFKAAKTNYDWREKVTGHKYHLPSIPPAPYTHFSGANVLFPAKELKEINWVPNDWKGFGYDDYWCALQWLAKFGTPIKMANESIAWHVDHPNSAGDSVNRKRLIAEQERLKPVIQDKFDGWWEEPNIP